MGQTSRRRFRHVEHVIRPIPKLLTHLGCRCLIAPKQTLPYRIGAFPKRGHPPHSGDRQTHPSTRRIRIEAFVPPKPKEFERAARTTADRDSFATTCRSRPSSRASKLILGGRN